MRNVRFKFNGKTLYGQTLSRKWYPDMYTESDVKDDEVLVEDAVTAQTYIVKVADVEEVKMELGTDDRGLRTFVDDYHQYIEDEFEKATKNVPDSFGKGSMLSVGVGDGSAWYVVTKVNKKTCDIEWRGFCADRYTDQFLGYGGRFDRDRIEPLVERRNVLTQMFS